MSGESGAETWGLINPLTGEPLPGQLEVTGYALGHMLDEHPGHPHEATFGALVGALRRHRRGHPGGGFPPGLLAEAAGVIGREVGWSLRRGWVMVYCVAGRPGWQKLVAVLRSGAMVPLRVDGDTVFLSHFFHGGGPGRPAWLRREAAARHLVAMHCPVCRETGRRSLPEPWHVVDAGHVHRAGERRYHIRFADPGFFGFPTGEPGVPWEWPDVGRD